MGTHQSGRNSNVIHAGVYYRPGTLRAELCRSGKLLMEQFLAEQGLPHLRCGKLVVATHERELLGLGALHTRASSNGVRCAVVDERRMREIEPECRGVRALHVPDSGVTDYRMVMDRLVVLLRGLGATIVTDCAVARIESTDAECVVHTTHGSCTGKFAIACAGLHSDRVARKSGLDPGVQVIPFRGEYFELKPASRHLVRGLIYPVPDPTLPFLGVHLTITAHGGVECGPNAVLAFAREGYTRTTVDAGDLFETLCYRGFWKLARKHWRNGLSEMRRSMSPTVFCRSLKVLVPAICLDQLVPVPSGVRAQAVTRHGELADDFIILRQHRVLHVCNAPSPAATASFAIGDAIVDQAKRCSWS